MKTYELRPTSNPELFRVVDRNGDWTTYFHQPTKTYLRAVNHILTTGYAKGPRFYEWLKSQTKEEAERILERAGERGDRIHQFIAKVLSGEKMHRYSKVLAEDSQTEVSLANDEWDAILAWQSFWTRHEPKLIAYEMSVFNLKVGYAGTLDAILRITKECGNRYCPCKGLAGKLGLYDWKSSSGIRAEYGAQIAAYGASESLKKFLGKHKLDYSAILRIGTNHKTTGGYELEVYNRKESQTHFKEFLAAVQIANAEYRPFDPDKEIYDIPDTLSMTVEREELNPPKPAKPTKAKRTPRKGTKGRQNQPTEQGNA